jgi:hypothetical protein
MTTAAALTKYGGMNSLVSNSDFVTPSHLNMKLHETEMRLRERMHELEMQIASNGNSRFDRGLILFLFFYLEALVGLILVVASAR